MTNPYIVHVMRAEKFIPAFVEFVDKHFDSSDHQFRVLSKGSSVALPVADNVRLASSGVVGQLTAYVGLIVALHKADRVMLHGLLNFKVIRLLWLMPWLRSKCYWGVWGHDLYCHEIAHTTARRRRQERVRQKVIKDIGHIVTSVEGDYRNAVQWYGATGQWHQTYWYPASLFVLLEESEPQSKSDATKILIGNSAAKTNNHIEVLTALLPYRDEKIELIVPLSYGSEKNAEEVIAFGQANFGGKFTPLTEFMALDEYNSMLSSIDIAVFHHRRQQAMSNIRVLLGMGKKVYLVEGVSSTESLDKLNIKTFRLADFSLERGFPEWEDNIKSIRQAYSPEALKANLAEAFLAIDD